MTLATFYNINQIKTVAIKIVVNKEDIGVRTVGILRSNDNMTTAEGARSIASGNFERARRYILLEKRD
jgi:hypothetical protein